MSFNTELVTFRRGHADSTGGAESTEPALPVSRRYETLGSEPGRGGGGGSSNNEVFSDSDLLLSAE